MLRKPEVIFKLFKTSVPFHSIVFKKKVGSRLNVFHMLVNLITLVGVPVMTLLFNKAILRKERLCMQRQLILIFSIIYHNEKFRV